MNITNTTGFPSPAQGYEKDTLDFNRILVKHPAATFTMRYTGAPDEETGIRCGDLLIVDCALHPYRGQPSVLQIDGEYRYGRAGEPCDLFFGVITSVVRHL